jgi:phosphoglucomutase
MNMRHSVAYHHHSPTGFMNIVDSGWFVARPSGTEDIIKVYAESFLGSDHLQQLMAEAQSVVSQALGIPSQVAATQVNQQKTSA